MAIDDSFNIRNQTVILIFLIHRNWFFPSESVVGVVGSLSFRSHSIFSAFEALVPSGTNKALLAKNDVVIHKHNFLYCLYTECVSNFLE